MSEIKQDFTFRKFKKDELPRLENCCESPKWNSVGTTLQPTIFKCQNCGRIQLRICCHIREDDGEEFKNHFYFFFIDPHKSVIKDKDWKYLLKNIKKLKVGYPDLFERKMPDFDKNYHEGKGKMKYTREEAFGKIREILNETEED